MVIVKKASFAEGDFSRLPETIGVFIVTAEAWRGLFCGPPKQCWASDYERKSKVG
jgi:hypothetical protein